MAEDDPTVLTDIPADAPSSYRDSYDWQPATICRHCGDHTDEDDPFPDLCLMCAKVPGRTSEMASDAAVTLHRTTGGADV